MFDYLCPNETQQFLDNVTSPDTLIVVSFVTQSGEERQYTGTLDIGANRSASVAINTDSGWKRFSVNRVTDIRYY